MRRYDDEDEWDEEPASFEDDDDEPTIPCPFCRREVLEDAPRCPYCERYISTEDGGSPGRPLWVVVTALVCLAMAIWWVVTSR
jgi:hypothetical protein